jgi:DNA repair protein RadA/Sms
VEEVAAPAPRRRGIRPDAGSGIEPVRLGAISTPPIARLHTAIDELDFVLGGGIVPGSLTLIGGEPGIGKSTLLLQCAAQLQAAGVTTLYSSGEESVDQVRLRAERIREDASNVAVLPEVRVEAVIERAARYGAHVLIIDSIQTMYTDELEGAPGNVGQVRECAARLMRFAKERSIAVLLVGHVTRGGGIAGPKTLEHVVDTVLYFEGDGGHSFRILRAVKNRFGSVDEVGVFEMTGTGLQGVANPSAAFLSGRDGSIAGSSVTALLEGTRPVLVEIQALAAKSGYGTPQRVATGMDQRRLAVLLAVLERRARLPFHGLDVFVNVTGGVRLVEPASDLAVVAALVSSVHDRAAPDAAVFLGEVGLGGEVRPVPATERRLAEAERLGFTSAFVSGRGRVSSSIATIRIQHVTDLVERIGG